MAYMIDLRRQCEHEGCPRFAEREVCSFWGVTAGLYCLPHARERVNELNEESPVGKSASHFRPPPPELGERPGDIYPQGVV